MFVSVCACERERERERERVEAVRRSRQEPAGLNSHCTGGANRRPGMELQMGTISGTEMLKLWFLHPRRDAGANPQVDFRENIK